MEACTELEAAVAEVTVEIELKPVLGAVEVVIVIYGIGVGT